MATRISEIIKVRRGKLARLAELGIEAFPAKSHKDVSNSEISTNFEKYEGKTLNVAGRLMSLREHGKVCFGHIQDQSEKIQLFIRQDILEPTNKVEQTLGFDVLELLDVGDFVEAFGEVVKTKTGEVSILVKKLRLLTKSLRPLPEKWKGLTNQELAFRKRYLDLLINQQKN